MLDVIALAADLQTNAAAPAPERHPVHGVTQAASFNVQQSNPPLFPSFAFTQI